MATARCAGRENARVAVQEGLSVGWSSSELLDYGGLTGACEEVENLPGPSKVLYEHPTKSNGILKLCLPDPFILEVYHLEKKENKAKNKQSQNAKKNKSNHKAKKEQTKSNPKMQPENKSKS